MTDRERLIELLEKAMRHASENYHGKFEDGKYCGLMADILIADGVTVPKPKFIRPPADLTGKCGSCIYAKPAIWGKNTSSYVECTNAEHIKKYCSRHEISKIRQRTAHACKRYKEKEES